MLSKRYMVSSKNLPPIFQKGTKNGDAISIAGSRRELIPSLF
jgi:hypothetical protein